jgi:hypothetical protein
MSLESLVGNSYLLRVPFLISTLVTPNKQDRIPAWIKGKKDAPRIAVILDPEFLHVGKRRGFDRVDPWPA